MAGISSQIPGVPFPPINAAVVRQRIYEIRQAPRGQLGVYTPYGGAREFMRYRGAEAIVHGPAETGKTLAALWKLHLCACKYPGASLVIARKTLTSIYSTTLQTFIRRVLGKRETWPCVPYGGEKRPERFIYCNKSVVWLAGFDKSSRVLSSEHDIIYVNQVEELAIDDWLICTTRTTGRAGNMPYSQTVGDANPSYPEQWIYNRPSLKFFYSKHQENPLLYDQATGAITAQGKRTMAVLDALVGVLRDRLRDGKAAQAEGAIYVEYNESNHRIYCNQVPHFTRYVAGIDWGYTNPGCIGVFGLTGDDDMYLVAQIYHRRKTDDWWLARALELKKRYHIEAWIADPSRPAYIDKFKRASLNMIGGFNRVVEGITAVKTRLSEGRLLFVRDSLEHSDTELIAAHQPHTVEQEFGGYVWSSRRQDEPVKSCDHGMDMMRYVTCYVDQVGTKQLKRAGAW